MDRKDLIKTINLTKPAIATKDFIPSFTCYCFTGTHVQAFNNVIAIRTPLETNFTGLVNGKLLLGLLNASTSEKVELKASKDKTNLELKMGRTNAKCPLMNVEEFLFEFPSTEESEKEHETNKDFFEALEKAMVSTVADNTLPNFMGVYLDTSPDGDVMWSTNNASLTKISVGSSLNGEFKFPLPTEFCQAVLDRRSVDECPKLIFEDKFIVAQFEDGTEILGKLFDDEIPNYELVTSMVTDRDDTEFDPIPLPKMIAKALVRAKVVADIANCHTKLIINDNKFTLLTESSSGIVKDSEKLKKPHPDITKIIDAERISDVLKYSEEIFITDNCVVLHKEDSEKDKEYLHLISNIVDI
jgi:DNA polymerase III sliding clamp (beta) subunit (PCNA family)